MIARVRKEKLASFKKTVWGYYKKYGRNLPWRETRNPYHILVSEIMLQQTQVKRVCEKYKTFISLFPNIHVLARASLSDVLRAWSGLGYNRRAKFLHELAKIVVNKHGGIIPSRIEELVKLPGIGQATGSSFLAFSHNQPTVFVETNIRSIFIHFFFRQKSKVNDKEIFPLVEKTLYKKNPREWYSALMDYGTMLKAREENPGKKSAQYVKQSRFEGSLRQLRGRILAECLKTSPIPFKSLVEKVAENSKKMSIALAGLEREGFLEMREERIILQK